ncbi:hypothetical protein [uncultured Clostridium sp.]
MDLFEKALFVFCNKQMDKLKILHFVEGFCFITPFGI